MTPPQPSPSARRTASSRSAGSGPSSGGLVGRDGRPRSRRDGGAGARLRDLARHQPVVRAPARQERRVTPALHDAASVEDQDPVGADHAREPVGADQRGPALHQAVERRLDGGLALRVDGRERLVEDEDRRVTEERAGDGDALALAAGEPHAPLADDGRVAVGEPLDERVGAGRARGGLQLGRRGVRLAHPEVVLDGAVEEVGVLTHHGDPAAERVEAELAHVAPADPHVAALRIVEAQEELQHRRLPRSARPHDRDALPGADREAQPLVGRPPAPGIGERDVLERDRGRQRGGIHGRADGIADQRLRRQHLGDALRRRQAEHALVEQDAQLAEWAEDLDPEHEDDQQRRERHVAGADPVGAEGEGRGRPHGHPGVGEAAGEGVGAEDAHGPAKQLPALALEPRRPGAALAEGLERGQALERVEQLRRVGAVGPLPLPAPPAVEPVPGGGRDERDDGREQEDDRDGPVDHRHQAEDEEGRGGRHQELRQILAEVDLELLHALDQRHHDVPGPLPDEVGGPEAGDVIVEGLAEARLDAGRRVVGEHGPRVLEAGPDGDEARHQRDRENEGAERGADQDPGQQPAEERQPGGAGGDGQDPEDGGSDDAEPQPLGEAPEPSVEIHPVSRGRRQAKSTGPALASLKCQCYSRWVSSSGGGAEERAAPTGRRPSNGRRESPTAGVLLVRRGSATTEDDAMRRSSAPPTRRSCPRRTRRPRGSRGRAPAGRPRTRRAGSARTARRPPRGPGPGPSTART